MSVSMIAISMSGRASGITGEHRITRPRSKRSRRMQPAFSVAGLCRAGPVRAHGRLGATKRRSGRSILTGTDLPWNHPGRNAARPFGIAGPAAAHPVGRDIADDRQGGRRGVRRCSAPDRGEIRRTSLREIRSRKTGPGHAEAGLSRRKSCPGCPDGRSASPRTRPPRCAPCPICICCGSGSRGWSATRPTAASARRRVAACPGARSRGAVGSLHVLRTAPVRRAACCTRA